MRVLGVDPGLRRTGYAIVNAVEPNDANLLEAGLVRLDARDPLEQRLVELDSSLDELIASHKPEVLACEQLFAHYKHPRTAILMGHARGVILALAGRRGLRVINVPATQAKKMLTGSGHAPKAQIQRAVALTLGLAVPPAPHDVADAIAIALCGARMASQAAAMARETPTGDLSASSVRSGGGAR